MLKSISFLSRFRGKYAFDKLNAGIIMIGSIWGREREGAHPLGMIRRDNHASLGPQTPLDFSVQLNKIRVVRIDVCVYVRKAIEMINHIYTASLNRLTIRLHSLSLWTHFNKTAPPPMPRESIADRDTEVKTRVEQWLGTKSATLKWESWNPIKC